MIKLYQKSISNTSLYLNFYDRYKFIAQLLNAIFTYPLHTQQPPLRYQIKESVIHRPLRDAAARQVFLQRLPSSLYASRWVGDLPSHRFAMIRAAKMFHVKYFSASIFCVFQ